MVGTSTEPATIESFYQQGLWWINRKNALPDKILKMDQQQAELYRLVKEWVGKG